MRLDELEEAEVKKVVFTFGRLNPPHFGHHALIQTLQKAAQKQNCDWFLFVSSKTGDEKNPLTYEQKVWWIQALFPETKGHLIIDQKIKTPLVAATWLYNQGYRAATFVAGEDDMSSYGEMIKSGNAHGQANPNALKSGKGFIFNPLDFAISPRLASATNARRNVADGDPEAFVRSILGPKINPQLAELVQNQLYPTLRKAMGLSESIKESWNVFPTVREIAQKHMTTPDEVHRQINRGVKVEFEKNQDIETATDIAMANLNKKMDYYTRLATAKNETVTNEVAKVKLSSDPNNFGAWVNDSGKPEKTIMIPINKLSGFEPDSKFDDPSHAKNLANIVKAIKAGKELPPILVRRHGVDRFQVLDGHHRFKAYRMAGMKSIPARLVDPKNVSEEKKPKKPKTIIDGALKTLIAKGRSEDEAIADLKKEIDGKFYDLTETREGALNWLKSYLSTWPEYVLRDWLYRGLTKHDPGENPKEVVDRSLAGEGMSARTQWKLIPNFEFKIEKLHPDTQRRINIRAGGSANPMKVPKDAERHATQAALAQQQGGVRKEPVIGKMTPQGFELIEGWHRTIQHFKQFPDGYTGPAWIAMNAVSENITEDESAKPLVYLDMDGVLADFFGDWSKISGVSHYRDIGNVEQALQLVRDHPTFWIDLPLLPNARALVKTVIEKYGEYRICSTPLAGDGRSKPGKIAWINKHFADMPPAEVVLTHNKAERAQHNGVASILVDDFGSNIDKWKAAGGIGIKYEDSAFPKVATILTSIAKSGVPK